MRKTPLCTQLIQKITQKKKYYSSYQFIEIHRVETIAMFFAIYNSLVGYVRC